MGRTVLDGRGGGPSRRDRQAIEWPPRPGGTVGGAPPGRPGGGRDSSGISGLTAIVIVFLALLLIGGAAYVVYSVYTGLGGIQGLVRGSVSQLDTPVSDDSRKVTFTVQPGQSAIQIGDELYALGLIRSPLTFRTLVEARGVGSKIESGEYELSPSMTTGEIVTVLSKGASRSGITITIPEGWRAEQAAQKVEALGIARSDEVLQLVSGGARAGLPLAEPLPAGATLEGYLFPETYEVAKGATARTLIEMMARQFDKAVTPKLRQQMTTRGLTLHQAVTLASIVEREAAIPAEQPIIASVYLNRLKRDMPLQADPTVQFAVASANLADALGYSYWKRDLSRDDLRLVSPYNTYVQHGLPPGPICSPGLAALEAVANPATTDYLYFVAKGDGSHVFATTDTEHAANVERYRR
jgi:UPF0755 protein